jgi:hypothetical protein
LLAADPTPGTNNITHEHVKCYNCHLYGHYSSNCPTAAQEEVQMLQTTTTHAEQDVTEPLNSESAFSLAQAATGHNIIPNDWILLDSQSTVSVFNNRALLTDIWKSYTILRVHTNGGTQISTKMGHVRKLQCLVQPPVLACQHFVDGRGTQSMPHHHGYFNRSGGARPPYSRFDHDVQRIHIRLVFL